MFDYVSSCIMYMYGYEYITSDQLTVYKETTDI